MSAPETRADGVVMYDNKPAPGVVQHEGFQASPSVGKLAGALAAAQGEFEHIGKTREVEVRMKDRDGKPGGTYKFAYAPLDTVLAAVRPALAKNGLAIVQTLSGNGTRVMTTTLMHASGEWLSSTVALPGQASSSQEFGSQVTYMRRYAIVSILGVVAEEDDDGNAADGNHAEGRDREPPPRKQKAPPPATTAEKGIDKALRITMLLTGKDGMGLSKQEAFDWLKTRFGRATPNAMSEQQQSDAEMLILAKMSSDDAYVAKVEEFAKAGRCNPLAA